MMPFALRVPVRNLAPGRLFYYPPPAPVTADRGGLYERERATEWDENDAPTTCNARKADPSDLKKSTGLGCAFGMQALGIPLCRPKPLRQIPRLSRFLLFENGQPLLCRIDKANQQEADATLLETGAGIILVNIDVPVFPIDEVTIGGFDGVAVQLSEVIENARPHKDDRWFWPITTGHVKERPYRLQKDPVTPTWRGPGASTVSFDQECHLFLQTEWVVRCSEPRPLELLPVGASVVFQLDSGPVLATIRDVWKDKVSFLAKHDGTSLVEVVPPMPTSTLAALVLGLRETAPALPKVKEVADVKAKCEAALAAPLPAAPMKPAPPWTPDVIWKTYAMPLSECPALGSEGDGTNVYLFDKVGVIGEPGAYRVINQETDRRATLAKRRKSSAVLFMHPKEVLVVPLEQEREIDDRDIGRFVLISEWPNDPVHEIVRKSSSVGLVLASVRDGSRHAAGNKSLRLIDTKVTVDRALARATHVPAPPPPPPPPPSPDSLWSALQPLLEQAMFERAERAARTNDPKEELERAFAALKDQWGNEEKRPESQTLIFRTLANRSERAAAAWARTLGMFHRLPRTDADLERFQRAVWAELTLIEVGSELETP